MILLDSKRAKLYSKACLLIIFLVLFFNCKKINHQQEYVFEDDQLHYAVYVDPSIDCLACILQAVNSLKKITNTIDILVLQTEDFENFINYIKTIDRKIKVIPIKKPLSFLHPAVVLIKKDKIFGFIYLSANTLDMQKIVTKMKDFLSIFLL